jgi:F0F1-type ATP synthase membrane subunit c/vacuolar-type H+-ATPase subunit K
MPDFTQVVTPAFIAVSITAIFVGIGIGIAFVKLGKKSRNPKGL